MKRSIVKIGVLLSAAMLSTGVYAYDFKVDEIFYNKIAGTTDCVEVTNEGGDDGAAYQGYIDIPATIEYQNTTYRVVRIGDNAFYNCALGGVKIPASIETIGESAFSDCETLPEITLPESVTEIGAKAFQNCKELVNFVIPPMITKINAGTFTDCQALTSISISDKITEIADHAFDGCIGLTEMNIPASVVNIGKYAFYSCNGLKKFNIDAANPNYCSLDGVFFNKAMTELIQYPAKNAATSYAVPITVKDIKELAFNCAQGLKSVTMGDNVQSIGEAAFFHCDAITSVVLSKSIKVLPQELFMLCSALSEFDIPEGVEKISDWVFCMCKGLSKITIPSTCKEVCDEVIADSPVTYIYSLAMEAPKCGEWAFTTDNYTAELHVPQGTKALYAAATGWSGFTDIMDDQPISDSGVSEVSKGDVKVAAQDGALVVESSDSRVRIYDADGRQVYVGRPGRVNVDAAGVYVVRTAGKVVKVNVK